VRGGVRWVTALNRISFDWRRAAAAADMKRT